MAADMTAWGFPAGGIAIIIGATGGIGCALVDAAQQSGQFNVVLALSRSSNLALEIESEAAIHDRPSASMQ